MSDQPVGGRTTTWDVVTSRLKKHLVEDSLDNDLQHSLLWAINIMEDHMGRSGGLEPRGWADWKAEYDMAQEYMRTVGSPVFTEAERKLIREWEQSRTEQKEADNER